MKPAHLLPLLATLVAAEHEEMDIHLEARADMTYWQNWCIAGGAVLAGVGTLASGIASIISASSSSSSCTVTTEVVEERSESSSNITAYEDDWYLNVTGVTENLMTSGFNISHAGWMRAVGSEESNNTWTFNDLIENEDVILHNLTIDDYGMSGFFIPKTDNETISDTDLDLEKRLTWSHKMVYVVYHSTGQCYTVATKAKIAAAVKKALNHQSTYKREAACYTLNYGGAWLGHLKVLEMYTDDTLPSTGYSKTCNGKKGVSNTCS